MADLITEPGRYDMTADEYHADPVEGGSLSSSGARRLLPPGCPALFQWERHNPPEPKAHFDIGHAAHKLVLGVGPTIVSIDAADWRTKRAKEEAAEERRHGAVPLLRHQYETVHAMADALRAHPFASLLFDPDHGQPEQTLVWRDAPTGIMRRARLDWLPDRGRGRLIVPDYKTAAAVDTDALARAAASHGYACQDDWYRAGCEALDIAGPEARFVFVFQAKDPPYLVHVVELDHVAQRIGATLNRMAINTYARCVETDVWPGFADDVTHLQLPAWYENQYGE